MAGKLLSSIFNISAGFENPVDKLEMAVSRYGPIKTFFSKYSNPVGIELEIENVGSSLRKTINDTSIYWRFHEDGSLKVYGAEFVSFPISGKNIDYAIHDFASLTGDAGFLYSVRTSTHVHVNVSFLTEDQFKLFICVAGFLEPLLFQLCKPERKHNPYCHPISQLSPEDVFTCHPDLKYCGINPAPVRKQLTLEFRQLHGNNDWRLTRRWIQLLCKIYFYIKNTPEKQIVADLKTACKGPATSFAKQVFGASMILFYDPETALKEHALWTLVALLEAENSEFFY